MIYLFGDHELDAGRVQLRRRGEPVRLQPKVFALLQHLIEGRGDVVTKDALLQAIWPGEVLSESVLARTVAAARKALGQQRGQRTPIETDYGRGYRFTADVQVLEAGSDEPPPGTPMAPVAEGDNETQADPFVGRGDELQQLLSGLAAAQAGQGQLLLLSGEPGIGKTRAAEETCARAKADGASVWTGRCFEGAGAPTFWPFIQILRACAEEESPAVVAALCGADHGLLTRLCPELGGPPETTQAGALGDNELSVDSRRFRLIDAIGRMLLRAAETRPRVLFLDDLQWADEPSLQVLALLVQELGAARLLLLGTLRAPALPHEQPARDLIDQLIRPRASERVQLSGLDVADIDAYIRARTGRPAPPGLAAAVRERTGGNPLFVRESLQLLLDDTEQLRGDPADGGEYRIELPEAALDVIRQRLSGLDGDLRTTLDCAAVFGAEVEFALLQEVLGVPPQDLLDILGDALALGLLQEVPRRVGVYTFVHDLVRDTLYSDLPSSERIAFHRRIGEVLAQVAGRRSDRLGEIAQHFLRALPDPAVAARAMRYARRAGDAAIELCAFDEAAGRYRSALSAHEATADPDPLERYRLLLLYGRALGMAGQGPRATEVFFRAVSLSRDLQRPELLGWAAFALAVVARVYFIQSDAIEATLQEALQSVSEDDRYLRPRLLIEAAEAGTVVARSEARERMLQEAVALLDPDDPETPWRTLRARLLATADPARIEARLEVLQGLVELGVRPSEAWIELDAKRCRYPLFIELGDIVSADRDLADCQRMADRDHIGLGAFFVQLAGLGRALAEGRLSDLERQLPRVVAAGRALHTPVAELLSRVHETNLRIARGDTQGLRAAPLSIERDFVWAGEPARIGALRWLIALGRLDEARAAYQRFAETDFENVPVHEYRLSALCTLAEVAHALRDRRHGQVLYELLRPFADRVVIDPLCIIEGSVRGTLGLLAALLHDPDAAREHLECSVALLSRMGLRALMLTDQWRLARVLHASDAPGARGQATQLAAQVRMEADTLGLQALSAQAESLSPL